MIGPRWLAVGVWLLASMGALAQGSYTGPRIVALRNAVKLRGLVGGHNPGGGLAGSLTGAPRDGTGIRIVGSLVDTSGTEPAAALPPDWFTPVRIGVADKNGDLPTGAGGATERPGGPAAGAPVELEPLPQTDPPYTGLVVDCRGFDIRRARGPRIFTADGTEVWGTVNVDPAVIDELGLVGYLGNVSEALNPTLCRAGAEPLFIRAIGIEGNFRADAVISDADAQRILFENERNGFVKALTVVFLVD